MLFTELALIRWTGANIIYLSYFSNFVLLGSFLGIGVGFLRAKARTDAFSWSPVALALLIAFVLVFPVQIDRAGSELIFFGSFHRSGLPTWATLPLVFLAVAFVMATIAEGVARTFGELEPLDAYRCDILGSIAGIVVFSALSFAHARPVFWGLVVAATFLVLLRDRRAISVVALVAIVAMLGAESLKKNETWSPYYRVTLGHRSTGLIEINVNGIPHQGIEDIVARAKREPIYLLPYERAVDNPLNDVLVIGAGNGTDVAFALAKGAKHVDAVEIDPSIQRLGVLLHPDHPYQDPRVSVHIDDGRAFLERSKTRYDLILFALPDSLTLVAGQSQVRLESFLFTEEALRSARDHLQPEGVFAMYNYYREQWLVDRLAGTLETVYGRPPCVDSVGQFGGLAMITTSRDPAALRCPTPWKPTSAGVPAPATDDHPFLYLRSRTVPGFYLLTILLVALASIVIVRGAGGPIRQMRPYLDLFFMGGAFLLLETKNVVQFALLFGTTWLVNALVFAGVLLTVLAAIEVARKTSFARPERLYWLLFVALAVAFVVPQHALLGLAVPLRFVAAVALAFAPIFMANLVFAERFKDSASSTVAFGANLLGAMIGGVLEYTSLVIGYRLLLVVVAALYACAYAFGRRALIEARMHT